MVNRTRTQDTKAGERPIGSVRTAQVLVPVAVVIELHEARNQIERLRKGQWYGLEESCVARFCQLAMDAYIVRGVICQYVLLSVAVDVHDCHRKERSIVWVRV